VGGETRLQKKKQRKREEKKKCEESRLKKRKLREDLLGPFRAGIHGIAVAFRLFTATT